MVTSRDMIKLQILGFLHQRQERVRTGQEAYYYGQELIHDIRDFNLGVIYVGPNIIYPILNEWSEDKTALLASWWEEEPYSKTRNRRFYRLTEKGEAYYTSLKNSMRDPLIDSIACLQRSFDTFYDQR